MKLKLRKKTFIYIIIFILIILMGNKLYNKYLKNNDNQKISQNPYTKYNYYIKDNQTRYEIYKNKTNYSDDKVVLFVNIGLDKNFYEDAKSANNLNTTYVLVNKYNYLQDGYVPSNLVKLTDFSKGGIYLNSEAYEAFKKMATDALIEDLNIRIISAYRSYDYQQNLYNNYLKKYSKEEVDSFSARAGYSEHQTGLAVDIDNNKLSYTNFGKTKEYVWMQENCYKYGFIRRYTKENEKITGYVNEPWHYRYVGLEISKYMHDNNIKTYEEYYYKFINNK